MPCLHLKELSAWRTEKMPDLSGLNIPAVALVIAGIGLTILLVILVWYIVMRSTFRKKVYAKMV